jgi:cell division protein FtsW (lipid II flippase)
MPRSHDGQMKSSLNAIASFREPVGRPSILPSCAACVNRNFGSPGQRRHTPELRRQARWCWIVTMELGWGFWLKLMGAVLVVGLAIWVIMLIAGAAFYAWGALGTMVFFIAVIVVIAYIYDRRQQATWEDDAT